VPSTDFVTPDNLLRAWQLCQSIGKPYSDIVGLGGLEGYCLDMAVNRWGTAFQSAVNKAVDGAKNSAEAEQKADGVLRRWVKSLRRYR
jgi:hypothetical protein